MTFGERERLPSTYSRARSVFGYFDEVCARFTRNGNPLFIRKTSTNATNVLSAFGKFNAIGFSPFFIERHQLRTLTCPRPMVWFGSWLQPSLLSRGKRPSQPCA